MHSSPYTLQARRKWLVRRLLPLILFLAIAPYAFSEGSAGDIPTDPCGPCSGDSRYFTLPDSSVPMDQYWEHWNQYFSQEGVIARGARLGYTPEQSLAMLNYGQTSTPVNRALAGLEPMTPELRIEIDSLVSAARPLEPGEYFRGTTKPGRYSLGFGHEPVFSSHSADPRVVTDSFLRWDDPVVVRTRVGSGIHAVDIESLALIDMGERERVLLPDQRYYTNSVKQGTLKDYYDLIGQEPPKGVDLNKSVTIVDRCALRNPIPRSTPPAATGGLVGGMIVHSMDTIGGPGSVQTAVDDTAILIGDAIGAAAHNTSNAFTNDQLSYANRLALLMGAEMDLHGQPVFRDGPVGFWGSWLTGAPQEHSPGLFGAYWDAQYHFGENAVEVMGDGQGGGR